MGKVEMSASRCVRQVTSVFEIRRIMSFGNTRCVTQFPFHVWVLTIQQEEHPPIIPNFGMGSVLVNYYRKKDEKDDHLPKVFHVSCPKNSMYSTSTGRSWLPICPGTPRRVSFHEIWLRLPWSDSPCIIQQPHASATFPT